MIEQRGNIWDLYQQDSSKDKWLIITTNGFIKNNGKAVMGAGIAKQAKERFFDLDTTLGKLIRFNGFNTVFPLPNVTDINNNNYNLICFPVKYNYWEKASLKLIEESLILLYNFIRYFYEQNNILPTIYSVKPGCGNGKLEWNQVKPIMEKYFKYCDNIIVVERQ